MTSTAEWNERVHERADEVGGVVYSLSRLLRPSFIARPGKVLVWGDWSAIEARALPWLCNDDPRAEQKLDVFRESDADPDMPDIYIRNAVSMGLFLDDGEPNRQTGKVAELSLGYGGGIGAFMAMAKGYNVHVSYAVAMRIRDTWRDLNPWASDKYTGFWTRLEQAAMNAINRPEREFEVGRLTYFYVPGALNGLGALWCKLPDDGIICYPNPRIEMVTKPWGKEELSITAIKGAFKPKQGEMDWPRVVVWPGLLAENATQATCARLLNDAIIHCPKKLPIIGHTHDELLTEVDKAFRRKAERMLLTHMEKNEPWAEGLPLVCETGYGSRYKIKGPVH